MITLILIYYLQTTGLSCETHTTVLPAGTSPMSCMVGAQAIAAQFIEDHPAYKLSTFRCKIENRLERAA